MTKINVSERMRERIQILLHILLLAGMVLELTYSIEASYEIYTDIHFYQAAVFFCLELFLLRKTKLYRPPFLVAFLGYALYLVKMMLSEYTVERYGEVGAQWGFWILVVQGLFLLLLVDVFISWKETSLRFSSRWYGIFTLITFVFMIALNFQITKPLLVPLLALFLTPLTEKEWKRFVGCLSIGYYLVFLGIYTRSLILVPPVAENLSGDRQLYLGTFLRYAQESAFLLGAFLMAFYWFLIFADKKNKWGMGICGFAMLYPLAGVLICGERVSICTLVIIVLLCYAFMNLKKVGKRRVFTVLGIVAVLAILFVVLLLVLGRISSEDAYEIKTTVKTYFGDRVSKYIYMLIVWGQKLYNFDSKLGYIPDGSILNPLDWFTSGRVSIWVESLRMTTWLGEDNAIVPMPLPWQPTHPHSTYFIWLRWYGWIGGTVLIAWFLTTIVVVCKRLVNREWAVLVPFFWIHFVALYGITERIRWINPLGFLFVIMLYPIILQFQAPKEGG